MPSHRSTQASPRLRRRLLVVAVLLLAALTGYMAVKLHDSKSQGGPASAAGSAHRVEVGGSGAAGGSTGAEAGPSSGAADVAGGPVPCVPSVLAVAASTDAAQYSLAQQPDLAITVTNTGAAPCRADLSDSQVELLVYNGESRVWSSHDCNIQPGTSMVTLAPRQTARRSIVWTGLSSQPHCAGIRMHVGAGNYTLHAQFAGIDGRTATFAISP